MYQQQQQNRFGLDALNRFLFIAAVAASVLAIFFPYGNAVRYALNAVTAACVIFGAVRLLAGKPERRYQENLKFLTIVTAVRDFFRRLFRPAAGAHTAGATRPRTHRARKAKKNPTWAEIRQYKYLICPQCTQRLRVPRGKGRLRVTCTRCGNVFETKS